MNRFSFNSFRCPPNAIAALISLYFVALGVAYSAATPPFEGPDELAHFVYIHNLIEDRRLPVIPDRATAFESRNYEVHQLPLYYIAATPLAALFERDDLTDYFRRNPFASVGSVTGTNTNVQLHPIATDGDTAAALWAVRLLSLALGTGTLWCVYHAGALVWDARTGLVAMFTAASIPTFIHISASANNDNLLAVLSSVVVVLALRAWTERRLTNRSALLAGAALGGLALTKLTGLTGFGYVVGMALVGWLTGRWGWRDAARYTAISAGVGTALAGWWYVRSVAVYGDPLAYDAARALWGREVAVPSGFELWGVWESFWMTLGHLNISGPVWLSPYVTAAVLVALVGVGVQFVRQPLMRWRLAFLLLVFLAVTAALVYVTRRMNISQGRALFPAMAAFAPLLVIGWRALLGWRLFWLPALPLAAVAVTAPFFALGAAFIPLEPVTTAAARPVTRIDADAEGLTVYGYNLLTPRARPGQMLALDVFFSGSHPQNPALFVTARDPRTGETLGTVDTYPGMAPTDTLDPGQTYRARVRLRLSERPTDSRPFQVQLAFGWRIPAADDPGQGRHLRWTDADGVPVGAVFAPGPVYTDPAYTPPPVVNAVDVRFGGQIRLVGCEVTAGLGVRLWWERVTPIPVDYTLTVGVAAADGELLTQQDAPPPGYPTSAWVETGVFTTDHALENPSSPITFDGEQALRVGWYTQDLGRLAAFAETGAVVRDDLAFILLERCAVE